MTCARNPEDPLSGDMSDPIRAARRAAGQRVHFQPGDVLYRPGDDAKGWIAVEQGRVRVSLTADTGREVVLYRIGSGDACLLTTSALMTDETLIAEAVAETEVTAWLVPKAEFERRLGDDAAFRRDVLRNYADRVAELVTVIQDVMFHGLPARLARVLTASAASGVVAATHQHLAVELGSAREVISRTLRQFEREGLVRTERGEILVLDAGRLKRLAEGS